MTDLNASYTAADTFPLKLLLNNGVKDFQPVHVQWIPTNRCNLRCKFCSCSERDRTVEMDLPTAESIIFRLAQLGCRAVTITGGGEPLLHEYLPEMLAQFRLMDIKIGLVTNGLLLDRLSVEDLSTLTWCRISNGDERTITPSYRRTLEDTIARGPKVDWAFSHVLSEHPNLPEIRKLVEFANEHQFTHVRIVADIFQARDISFDSIREELLGIDQRVIYQPRNAPVRSSLCAIGYIKPVIAPDFNIYHCCGVQYAMEEPRRDLPQELCMGSAKNLDDLYVAPKVWSVNCARCYYEAYNKVLRPLLGDIRHEEFL